MDARELTRDEKKKIRTLVTGMCANYDRKSVRCLPLDCACYMLHKCWTGAYCRYFREAVLPLNPELQASLTTEGISPELRACACLLYTSCPPGLRFQTFFCTGYAGMSGLWQCIRMMPSPKKQRAAGAVPAKKNGQTNKIHLSIRSGGAAGI